MRVPFHDVTMSTYEDLIKATGSPWLGVLDSLPIWFWQCNDAYELTYVSDTVHGVTGTAPHLIVGVCILEEGHVETENQHGLSDYHEVLTRQKPFEKFCYERRLRSGERAVLMDSGTPRFDENGRFLGYRGVSLHLTNAVRTAGETGSLISTLNSRAEALEQELQDRNRQLEASNKLLKEVVDAMGQGLLVSTGEDFSDENNKVVMVNPAFCEIFDISEGEVAAGTQMSDAIATVCDRSRVTFDDEVLQYVQSKTGQGDPWVINIKSLNRAASVQTARRPSGGYVIVHTDVTDLRDRNTMLEQARDAAQVANQAKSNFLATMSHEIRTPMNGVVGMADLLAASHLDEDQLGYVETIRTSALALTGLISDILDFSKIEAGHISLQCEPFNLRKVINAVSGLVAPLAHVKGLDFDVNVADDLPAFVIGDPLRLRQVLLNLLGNAVKFTQIGRVGLSVSCGTPPPLFIFEVTDTGIGIADDKIEDVFSPFEQVDAGFQRAFEGTGLGLSITRTLAQAMNGDVSVTSEPGKGSVFTLGLPLETSHEADADLAEWLVEDIDCSGAHILVAEDNRTNQLVVQRMIERTGARLTIVHNGQEAIDAYGRGPFDLVLMDLSMPVMNGLDACRGIRELENSEGWAARPVIALTGNAFQKDKTACVDAGMNGFLSKPVRLADILQCLSHYLTESEKGDGSFPAAAQRR